LAFDELDMFDDDGESSEHTYLTFRVAQEEYAVPVVFVTEIVRLQKSHPIPDVPDYIRGVINLRGQVIPILDVRGRFGLGATDRSDRTVVVVLEVEDAATGLLVDAVAEVVDFPPEDVDASLARRGSSAQGMVKGVAKRDDRVTFILDPMPLLGAASQAAHEEPALAMGA